MWTLLTPVLSGTVSLDPQNSVLTPQLRLHPQTVQAPRSRACLLPPGRQLPTFTAVQPRASSFTPLGFSSLICQIGKVTISVTGLLRGLDEVKACPALGTEPGTQQALNKLLQMFLRLYGIAQHEAGPTGGLQAAPPELAGSQ